MGAVPAFETLSGGVLGTAFDECGVDFGEFTEDDDHGVLGVVVRIAFAAEYEFAGAGGGGGERRGSGSDGARPSIARGLFGRCFGCGSSDDDGFAEGGEELGDVVNVSADARLGFHGAGEEIDEKSVALLDEFVPGFIDGGMRL